MSMYESREEIRITLAKNSLSNVWLVNQLSKKGIPTNSSTLSAAITGKRGGEQSEMLIGEALKIVREYEAKMNDGRN